MTSLRAPEDTFRILFVCTANICRSPVAEILMRRMLMVGLGTDRAARFAVESAGTHAVTGAAMSLRSRAALAPWGLGSDAAGSAARQVDAEMVRQADIVLTADRNHRSFIVALEPSALRTTFCIREWDRLLRGKGRRQLPPDPVARARSISAGAHLSRGTLIYASAADDSIPDPAGLPMSAHRSAMRMIASAVQRTVDILTIGTTT
ncbi:MAG: low molecular weight protein-tyrosine phosphatase [Actinomycetota bacterium]|jgi:protein-tyrosine phosphatase|nr:low molecular weight protein-tyrosine phosphatase [Actinomycetota bacterium]